MAVSASGVADNPVIAIQRHGEDEQDVRNVSVVQDAAPDNVPQNVPVSVSNADINVKLGDGRSLIFNTLLTFFVSAMSNALKMNVVQLIVINLVTIKLLLQKMSSAKILTICYSFSLEKSHNIDQRNLFTLRTFMMA